jgi:hypothetical protein
MDAALLENLIGANKPFQIGTASGRVFNVPHRDFINFTPRKTSVFIFYEENGQEHFPSSIFKSRKSAAFSGQ